MSLKIPFNVMVREERKQEIELKAFETAFETFVLCEKIEKFICLENSV